MKYIFIVWACLMVSHVLSAQQITVVDESDAAPLEFATLMSVAPHHLAYTDVRGQTPAEPFAGSERISIFLLGYRQVDLSYDELEAADFKVALEPTGVAHEVVVMSATRWNQSSGDVPGRIGTISSRKVALQNPQTAADLLGTSGEVFIQKSQQGGGSPMIRGFATNRLLYSVDGVRMNTAIFRSGNLQNVISLDPYAIAKTEIFFGPGAIIYGSDAIGGVMSFRTLDPELAPEEERVQVKGKAAARYATANHEKTGHVDLQLSGKRWGSVTSLSANDYGDLRMGNNGPEEYLRPTYVQRVDRQDVVVENDDPRVQVPTAYSQVNLMQKFRFRPTDHWDLKYAFHWSKTSEYGRYDRHLQTEGTNPRYGVWKYGPQKWMMNHFSARNTRPTKLYDALAVQLAHQRFGESRISRRFNQPVQETRTERVDAYSVNVDLRKSMPRSGEMFYGVEGIRNDVLSVGENENIGTGITSPGPARYPNAVWSSYAAYLSYTQALTDKVKLQGGARYSYFRLVADFDTTFFPLPFTTSTISNGALNGNLGLVYTPTNDWILSVNLATGFRAPNVDDIGKVFDSEPGAVVVPNPNLQAEYAYNADIGIARVFGDVLKVDVTGFYTLLENALVRRDFVLNGRDSIEYEGVLSRVQAVQNAATANVYGVQAGFEMKLPSGWGLSSRFNFQRGMEELDDGSQSPSRHAAPAFGVTRLSYATGPLKMQLYTVYSGRKTFEQLPVGEQNKPHIYAIDENGNPWSPGWYTLNFKAMLELDNGLLVNAGLENITDQRYRPFSSGLVAAGRNVILGLAVQF